MFGGYSPPPPVPPRDFEDVGLPTPPTSPVPPKRILMEEETFLLRSPPVPPRDDLPSPPSSSPTPSLASSLPLSSAAFTQEITLPNVAPRSSSSVASSSHDIELDAPPLVIPPASVLPSSPDQAPRSPSSPPAPSPSPPPPAPTPSSPSSPSPTPPSSPNNQPVSSSTPPSSPASPSSLAQSSETPPPLSCVATPSSLGPISSPHDEARVPSSPSSPSSIFEVDESVSSPPLPPLSSPPLQTSLSNVEKLADDLIDNHSLVTWGMDLFLFFKLVQESRECQEQATILRRSNKYPAFSSQALQDSKAKQEKILQTFDELLSRNPFSLAISEHLLFGLVDSADEVLSTPNLGVGGTFARLQSQLVDLKKVIEGPYHRTIYHWHPEQPTICECLLLLSEFGQRALSTSEEGVFSLPPASSSSRGAPLSNAPPSAPSPKNDRFRRVTFAFSLTLPVVLALSPHQANNAQSNHRFPLWEQSFKFPSTCFRPFASRPSYCTPLPSNSASFKLFNKLLQQFKIFQKNYSQQDTLFVPESSSPPPPSSSLEVQNCFRSLHSFAANLLCGFQTKEWMANTLSSLAFRNNHGPTPSHSMPPFPHETFLKSVLALSSFFLEAFVPDNKGGVTFFGPECNRFYENLWSAVDALAFSKDKMPRSLRELLFCAVQIQTPSDLFVYYHELLQRCALCCQWLGLELEMQRTVPKASFNAQNFYFSLMTLGLLLQGSLVEIAYFL